ncbi:MAG: YihY/virulence factor BrkB family protein [Hamadaea sp.]|uniref:YihY/virulence factor BrkB family protein n=1 Tax=Hamadaea sp. TaxID=2024425 RepID=UPI001856522E|nr:YihY/virulence factor BrkB family protein [Hamadaea sp.]NUT19868.1 YihY/virulence factor BrkB family protein [Hamadaea sp.]
MTDVQPPPPDAGPSGPTKLGGGRLLAALKRVVREFSDDNLTVWAAALTYYGVLSLFPGLLALVAGLGLISEDAFQRMLTQVLPLIPAGARDIVTGAADTVRQGQGHAGVAAVLGVLVAIWSASGYVGAFMQASNVIYDVREGRPIWKTLPIRLAVTIVIGVLLIASILIVVLSGQVATRLGEVLGLGSATVTAWNIAKWPVLVVLVALMFAILYWASPNARQGGFRWISPGGFLAVVLWIGASVLFGLYAANFGSYNKTYGTLGGVVIFLVWLWLSNLAILVGAELDAELERGRAIAAGHPADKEPYLQLRDTRKLR